VYAGGRRPGVRGGQEAEELPEEAAADGLDPAFAAVFASGFGPEDVASEVLDSEDFDSEDFAGDALEDEPRLSLR
jgi:hypothetical protein